MAFQRSLAYRIEYYTGVLNASLYIFVFTSVWKAVIPEGTAANGLTRDDMVAYAVLATLIKVSFGRNESLFSSRIRTGEIAVDLMKPYNFPLMYFCDIIGVSLFQLFARAIPILVFSILIFNITFVISPLILLKFIIVFLLAFCLYFSISFLISTMAFFFVEVFPFWVFYFSLITLTSGAIIPLDFFPLWLSRLLNYSPFPYLYYFPTMILLQKSISFTYADLLFNYTVLILLLLSAAIFSYRQGIKKMSIVGG